MGKLSRRDNLSGSIDLFRQLNVVPISFKCCHVPRRLFFSLSLSLNENVRAKEAGKETTGVYRLPWVPFPRSLAVHYQSLASTLRKTKRLRMRLI